MISNKTKYILGILSSQLGSAIQSVILPLFVLDLTGSGTIMSIFFSISISVKLMSFPFAGKICDKYNKKNLLVISDIISGILIVLASILTYNDYLNLYILLVIQIIVSFVSGVFQTASSSIVPNIIHKSEILHVNTIKNIVINASYIVGPAVGGILYGLSNMWLIFLINGVSFILSSIIESTIDYKHNSIEDLETNESSNNYLDLVKYFYTNNKDIVNIFLLIFVLNFLTTPLFSSLYPVFFKIEIGITSYQYGIIQSGLTIGLLFTSIILLKKINLNSMKSINNYLFIGIILYSTGVISSVGLFYTIDTNFIFISQLISIFILGLGAPIFDICIDTYIQEKINDENLGKAFALLDFIGGILSPLSVFIFGLLLKLFNVDKLLLAIGTLLLVVAVIYKKIQKI